METEITRRQRWACIDGNGGLTWVPLDDCPDAPDNPGLYYDGTEVRSVELELGFGVRESAPGYMDATPWEVYATEAEARARADEIDAEYMDDSDDGGDD